MGYGAVVATTTVKADKKYMLVVIVTGTCSSHPLGYLLPAHTNAIKNELHYHNIRYYF